MLVHKHSLIKKLSHINTTQSRLYMCVIDYYMHLYKGIK